tara:strand:- start:113 stop:223 length:111 start_codon:yes stop_codon:yes gene_type:complete
MKIEFTPSPELVKWVILAVLIISGTQYDELMILAGV